MMSFPWNFKDLQNLVLASLAAVALAACGGGGGGPAQCIPGVSTMAFPAGCPGDNVAGVGGSASIALSLIDADSRATINTVMPSRPGELRATLKTAAGTPAPNVAVSFSTNDSSGSFVPSSGTALTNDSGVATVRLPAGSRAGAFTVSAAAAVASAQLKTSVDYAVTFPTLTLGTLAIAPATLSAGGNASVSVAVLSDGVAYTPPLAVSFTSPCIAAGKASMGASVLTQLGVANSSYTDRGCGVPDVITASVTLADATFTKTGTITVLPASVGSIRFVSADTTNIALKGTGGFGRQETSKLTFAVYDQTGTELPGALVDFRFADSNSATTVGGLTLNPAFATAAAGGLVTTLVTAGTVPTSVRVVASIRGTSPPITTLSNILVVSSGVPDQKHFSLSTETGNCEGWNIDQECSIVTVTLGDHFGNPVPDGTAVNFSAEGGVIDASCVTGSLVGLNPKGEPVVGSTPGGQTTNSKVGPGSGTCSVVLRSSNPRPADGRVTVLAYALGEEDFIDANGNNVQDAGEAFTDKKPDIFRNDNEAGVTLASPDGTWNAGEPCVGPNTANTCSTAGDGQYNGVLRSPQVASPQSLYVHGQLVQTFSGSNAEITFSPGAGACPASGVRDGQLRIADVNDNLMPAGSEIYISRGPVFLDPPIARVRNVVLAVDEKRPMGPFIPVYVVPVSCTVSSVLFVKVVTPAKQETINSFQINP